MNLDQPVTRTAFAELVGISQPAVSKHIAQGTLVDGAPLRAWLLAYCGKLRAEAFGENSGESLAPPRAKTREPSIKAGMRTLRVVADIPQLADWGVADTKQRSGLSIMFRAPSAPREAIAMSLPLDLVTVAPIFASEQFVRRCPSNRYGRVRKPGRRQFEHVSLACVGAIPVRASSNTSEDTKAVSGMRNKCVSHQ
ncbi:hypothetical protein [Thiosocius teredinicola]|uniref:hypothetical protein n=1 Tax=Thiosocius teredinicola TaxID=1973002 RepID=UPI000F7B5FDC